MGNVIKKLGPTRLLKWFFVIFAVVLLLLPKMVYIGRTENFYSHFWSFVIEPYKLESTLGDRTLTYILLPKMIMNLVFEVICAFSMVTFLVLSALRGKKIFQLLSILSNLFLLLLFFSDRMMIVEKTIDFTFKYHAALYMAMVLIIAQIFFIVFTTLKKALENNRKDAA